MPVAPKRLLFVDDHRTNREYFERLAKRHGFQVKTTESAEEAHELARTFKPHVLIIDWQLGFAEKWNIDKVKWGSTAERNYVMEGRSPQQAMQYLLDHFETYKDRLRPAFERMVVDGYEQAAKMLDAHPKLKAIISSGAPPHTEEQREILEKYEGRMQHHSTLYVIHDGFFESTLPYFLLCCVNRFFY